MVLRPAFIDNYITSFEPERRRIVSRIGRPVPILAAFTDATVPHVNFGETEEDGKDAICEVAKMKTIPPSSEAVMKMVTRSTGTFIVEAKRELIVRTSLLVARRIVEVRLNKPFHVVVENLSKIAITVLKHT